MVMLGLQDWQYYGIINKGGFRPNRISGLQLWLDANDSSTLWQESTFTTPAGNGDVVGGWQDKTENGNNVLQTTTSKKPTLQTGVQNSLPVVRFAGTDDVLTGGDILDLGTNSVSLYIVAKKASGSDGGYVAKSISASAGGRYGVTYASGNMLGIYSAAESVSVARVGGSFEIISQIIKRDGDANRLRANGAEIGNNPFVDDTANDWNTVYEYVVGNYGTTGSDFPLTGDVCEVIQYNRDLTSIEQGQIETYLSTKWGVALS